MIFQGKNSPSSQNNIGCASTPNTTIRFTLYATTICTIVMSRHIWRHFSLCSKPFEGSVFQWYWFRLRHGAASALIGLKFQAILYATRPLLTDIAWYRLILCSLNIQKTNYLFCKQHFCHYNKWEKLQKSSQNIPIKISHHNCLGTWKYIHPWSLWFKAQGSFVK